MKKDPKKYNYIEDHLNKIRSKGGYFFTYQELYDIFNVSREALNLVLYRLKARKLIAQVIRGCYVIIPPEYTSKGILPAYLFIDDLMKSLDKKYYVGLLSAAALHGAAHQQPMEYFIITESPAIRKIKQGGLAVNFFTKQNWSDDSIIKKKTDAGYINVSSPELTALDLFFYSNAISLNRAYTVLQELQDEMKPSLLTKVAGDYPQTSSMQRLGYILEHKLNNEKLSSSLYKVLSERKSYYLPLSPNKPKKGNTDTKWKIIINTEVEGDL